MPKKNSASTLAPLARRTAVAATAIVLTILAGRTASAATITTYPLDPSKAGFVDEFGFQIIDEMVSGSVALIGFGEDCRAYAEFDLSAIPDGSVVLGTTLEVWLANHDNPGDPAVPLDMEIHATTARASDPPFSLHAAIGGLGSGSIYLKEPIERTGIEFCPDAFVKKVYDLGAMGVANVQAGLAADYLTVGFVSQIVTDPLFDHIDYIGYTEQVANFVCATTDLPGSRIALIVRIGEAGCAPRNHGFWHRYCLGQDAIDPGRHGHGNGPDPSPQHTDLPAGLLADADAAMKPYGMTACQALDEGPLSDPRLAALRELSTIYLNIAAGMLNLGCEVELHPVDKRKGLIVADAIDDMTDRLATGTVDALHEARWIGEHVVNGEALLKK